MSLFGKLRRAKQAADEQKGKHHHQAVAEDKPIPYKHVPTHAATDALLGAPATWREDDKRAIQAQNHRRSRNALSRNPSTFSNGNTLNRDQSWASTDYSRGGPDQHRQSAHNWGNSPAAGRDGRGMSSENSSSTNFSRYSQLSPVMDRAPMHSSKPRSRIDGAHPVPKIPAGLQSHHSVAGPSKDVKFSLPSSREISPGRSSQGSHYSSREPSNHDLNPPPRHPRRSPLVLDGPGAERDGNHHRQPYSNFSAPPTRPTHDVPQHSSAVEQPATRSPTMTPTTFSEDRFQFHFPPPPPTSSAFHYPSQNSPSPLLPDIDYTFINFERESEQHFDHAQTDASRAGTAF